MIHTDGWICKTSSLFGHFMHLVQKVSFTCRYPLSLDKCDEHFATSSMDTMIDTFSLTGRIVLWYAISRVKPHSSQDGCWHTDISICFHVRYWSGALGDAAPSSCDREPVLRGCSGTDWYPQQQEVFLGTCNGW